MALHSKRKSEAAVIAPGESKSKKQKTETKEKSEKKVKSDKNVKTAKSDNLDIQSNSVKKDKSAKKDKLEKSSKPEKSTRPEKGMALEQSSKPIKNAKLDKNLRDGAKALAFEGKREKAPKRPPFAKAEQEDEENSDFGGFSEDEDEQADTEAIEVDAKPVSTNHDPNKSRESHKKQKEQAAARKAAKPNADEILRAKKLWEKLRLKSHIKKEERQELLTELFAIITGRIHDFVFKHDSVRVIQCAVKYSTITQKREIATELKGAYRQLAESRYAKFLLAKLITEGDEETKNMIIPEFYGHVRRLLNHAEASWILDDIYRSVAEPSQKARILRELYGPEFAVFTFDKDTKITADLPALIKAEPAKRKPILDYLQERINQLIQKKMTGFTILHDAMLQYFKCLSPESDEFKAFIRLIIGDNKEEETDLLRNLAFTQSGSEIVCLALAYSPAKDRRQILKAYKEVMEMLAFDQFGHRVVLTAFEVMDDTREITNRVFSEILMLTKGATSEEQSYKIVALATGSVGHVTIMYPYIGAEKTLVPYRTLLLMQKVRDIRKTTSKKDPAVRKSELLAILQPLCLEAIRTNATELITSSYGSQLILEVTMTGSGEKSDALQAIAKSVQGDPSTEGHIARTSWAGKLLKTLVSGGRFSRAAKKVVELDPPLHFADTLLESIQPHLKQWIVGDGGFVVLALTEATWKDKPKAKIVTKAIKESKLDLQAAVKAGADEAGIDIKASERRRHATSAKHLLQAIEK